MIRRYLVRGILTAIVVAAISFAGLASPSSTPPAEAAFASDFDAGHLISDAVFYDGGAMTADQIQSLLNTKGASCKAGEMPCLKDYVETTRDWAVDPGLCAGYAGRSNETAAQIIARVATSCNVSPRVLLVLLEKEQGLVTRTAPTRRAYDVATGYGCPDGSPCNSEYYGFFNQVYRAAHRFNYYRTHPTSFGYQAGRDNFILYNPNTACGGASVFIRNQATAGLYIYTPYQPNAAALANLYGTGDSCSAYGNRNFWRIFSDWFFDPRLGTAFVKSASSPDVYLVNGSHRYRVPDYDTLLAYSPQVRFAVVSDSYLARRLDGGTLSRFARDETDGRIYFVDSGIRLHISSCALMVELGSACEQAVNLNHTQIEEISSGPPMTQGYETTNGKRFFLSSGQRREVFDAPSLVAEGLPTATVRLSESGVRGLPYGTPIIRDGVIVTNRQDGTHIAYQNGAQSPVPDSLLTQSSLRLLSRAAMDAESLTFLPAAEAVTGVGTDSSGTRTYMLTASGRLDLTEIGQAPALVLPRFSDSLLADIPIEPAGGEPVAIKAASVATVSLLVNGSARDVRRWDDLVAVSGGTPPVIHTVADITRREYPNGPTVLSPGTLVKGADDPMIFFIDDLDTRVPVETFAVTDALGLRGWTIESSSDLEAYTVAEASLSAVLTCGTEGQLGRGGQRAPLAAPASDLSGFPATPLDPATCRAIGRPTGEPQQAPLFLISTTDPEVYRVIEGVKHPIQSWADLLTLNAPFSTPTIVRLGPGAVASLPTGASLP